MGPLGRLEHFLEAGEKETRYLYNPKGQLDTIIKPSGAELHHEYDECGRLARYFSSDFDYRYTYDGNDRVLSVYDEVSKTSTTRAYNALGNVTQEILGTGLKMVRTFDSQGRVLSLKLPNDSLSTYAYEGVYLRSVHRNEFSCTYERDLEGSVIKTELPIGTINLERDALCRWKKCDSPFFHSKESYDPVGNLIHYYYQDALGDVSCVYTYDALDQLTSENEHTYLFDSLHNRLKKDEYLHEVNNLCQILQDGQRTYEYDHDGNLTFDGQWHYTYDTQDRLVRAEKEKTCIEYFYDPFHRRLSKTVNGNAERYLWDGDNEIGVVDEKDKLKELRILGEGLGAEISSAVLY